MKGSCLCGAVAYQLDRIEKPITHCHCLTCQKAHSAAFNSSVRIQREDFHWTRGEDKLSCYESSPGKKRWFCSVCGSHLMAEKQGQELLVLRAASLDEDPGVRPAMHIWRAHDRAWLVNDESLPSHPEWPPA
ncbi:MAG: GFA family protein [Pseudomonadales bacterium]|nr:GFA family protein [Pseudomonadales bacterium]